MKNSRTAVLFGPSKLIAVPQSVFRSLLNPAYADEFAGAPVKAGDVTPKAG